MTVRPYYLTGPCPPWCAYRHDIEWSAGDRQHRGKDSDVTLTAMDSIISKDEVTGKLYGIAPRIMSASLWQHYREAEPRVNVAHGDESEAVVYLTLDEAEQHARHLLALVATARKT